MSIETRSQEDIMPVRNVSLACVSTRSNLAAELGVPVPALNLVSLGTPPLCKTNRCPLHIFLGNHSNCLICSQAWFPQELNKKGLPATHRRGYGLYGRQFLPQRDIKSNPASCCCCCTSPLCENIGYSHTRFFCFPTDPRKCAEAVCVLGIKFTEEQKKIVTNPRKYRITPWQFNSRHWHRGPDGKWHLRKGTSFRDADSKLFSFHPPDANIQHFIDEEILSSGFSRGGVDDTLPDWVRILTRLQQTAGENAATQHNNQSTGTETTKRIPPPHQSGNGSNTNRTTTRIPPPLRLEMEQTHTAELLHAEKLLLLVGLQRNEVTQKARRLQN